MSEFSHEENPELNLPANEGDTPATPEPAKPEKRAWFSPNFAWPRRIFLGLIGVVSLAVLVFLLVVSSDLPPMDLIENPDSDLSTQVLSADGVVLQKFYSRENRVTVKLNEISPHVVNALIATEDVRFYKHSGIDPKSFFTILKDVVTGDEVRGGSTITMQLVRNLYDEVGNKSTIVRKVMEYLVSAYIERRFTKLEIMEAYLNTVNIYGNSYGIETTANRLFDKSAKDLTVEEAAMVVGMLKGQGVYNPFRHPETTQNRRNTILGQMVKYEFLDSTQVDVDSIKAIPLEASLVRQEQSHVKGLAPYFREKVREELSKWCKDNDYNLYTDGLRVYTTLDSRMQLAAETAVREHLSDLQKIFDDVEDHGDRHYKKDPSILVDLKTRSYRYIKAKRAGKSPSEIEKEFRTKRNMTIFTWEGERDTVMSPLDSIRHYARFLETGMVSIDPTTGQIKAWVGGIDYKHFKYDHVAKGKRQVGSTFKPFVYGTAVTYGHTPCDKYLNQPVTFEVPGGTWTPKNSGGEIGGLMTLRKAMANSVNLVTAQLMKEVGPPSVAEFAYNMGIKTKLDEVPSLCLGTTDLSVLELTGAYSTFANRGTRIEPYFITRIEDKNGNVLATFHPQAKEVLSREQAFLIVELLKGVVDQGTGQRLRYRYKFKNEIGGKTGTTQNQSDGWFMGVTPNLVTGVWVGCADRRMRFRSIKYGQGANMALPIWALYMQKVYENSAIGLVQEPFQRPEGLNIDLSCGMAADTMSTTPVEEDPFEPSVDDIDDF
ncbi:PBP1A family penicillin-binding protein [Pontibacter sp. G13]|uniref:penicillin-binding protein 1A n=1 Tax=Pontibacter sp. G13 TaxID=3074898 RepID=UPI00288BE0AA|nr:PBP1A family penicillin-binding protein [Pontibacter sp. G13]WNJ16969.1 PBP1A family penicillin-binding protein [Pontibacter sp. G13]